MRTLLNGALSCVRPPSNGRLVIGLRPAVERVALLVLGLGLLLLGLPLALLMEAGNVPADWFLPGAVLTMAGSYPLFLQSRLLFDRNAGQFWLVRPFRKALQWPLDDVQGIELLRAWKLEDLKLVLRDGDRLLVFQTQRGRSEHSAEEIAAFLQVPIERRDLT